MTPEQPEAGLAHSAELWGIVVSILGLFMLSADLVGEPRLVAADHWFAKQAQRIDALTSMNGLGIQRQKGAWALLKKEGYFFWPALVSAAVINAILAEAHDKLFDSGVLEWLGRIQPRWVESLASKWILELTEFAEPWWAFALTLFVVGVIFEALKALPWPLAVVLLWTLAYVTVPIVVYQEYIRQTLHSNSWHPGMISIAMLFLVAGAYLQWKMFVQTLMLIALLPLVPLRFAFLLKAKFGLTSGIRSLGFILTLVGFILTLVAVENR